VNLLEKLAQSLGFARIGKRAPHGFAAAEFSRLTASLRQESEFINTVLRYQLRPLRARARQAAQNNPFARRFAQMVVDNVAGPTPFGLEAKIKNRIGKLDRVANDQVEVEWDAWGKRGACEVTGKWSWNALQRMLVRTFAIDGEILLRIYRGPEYGRHGYRLQVIDVDRLWEWKNEALADGGAIHMSVQVDPMGKPTYYHVLKRKPAQWQVYGYTYEFEVIPASEIIHIFIPEHAEQVRGVPWMYAALLNLVNLGAFEEAAVIAARVGAAAMGVLQSPDGGGSFVGDGKDAKGNPQIEAEPGTFPMLPPGYQLNKWDPKYPDAAMEPFVKACLRGVAAGLGVAYHNLANDLENVNYSSARIGELDERDAWMGLQNFMTEHLHQPLYDDWLRMAVVSGALPFDLARLDKYKTVLWQPRRWAWVDPMKEVGAAIEAINAKIKSRTRIVAEGGEDIEDVFEEIEEEAALAEEHGISLEPIQPKATGVIPDGQGAGDDEGTDGGNSNSGKKKRGAKKWDT
jgi:lambda family phage portal protein